ncbi:ribosomal-processing cysteine protease Prp [uncultured Faecalicoccus sp.]|uniref:ribosomal-processing cysteine protease Prp n=1 Tax=uncultured Faecalicoccus sp. TaxID=1971760 RepID=UPI0025CF8B25|nr:ribosomal-processing cysteine protease Prp [uncultured Faecalicoccus sp.]
MIKVYLNQKSQRILSVKITGHANSTTEMLDLVCAEVSAVSVGALNAIETLCKDSCLIQMESGYVSIEVKSDSDTLQIILKTLVIQLETIIKTNKKYIKMIRREV